MSVHGGNVDEISRKYGINKSEIVDFSANINPLGLSKKVKEAMIRAIDKVEKYPDITYFDLKKTIANFEGISSENIILGNGAAEVIFNIVRALKPKKVLLCAPTFSEYEEAVLSIDSEIVYYYLKESNGFYIDDEFIQCIDESIDLIFICNPNNPTGVLTENKVVEKIVEKANKCNAIVVTDESFLDFIEYKDGYTAKCLLDKYDNLIIVKSLTKFFAMPGIRIGYGICNNTNNSNVLEKVMVPWSVNIVASEGILHALEDNNYMKNTIKYVKDEKEYLQKQLSKINWIRVYKPSVNFIFFKVLRNIDLKEELIKENILIRSCSNYHGIDKNYYRIAVRTSEENKLLINTLKNIIIDND